MQWFKVLIILIGGIYFFILALLYLFQSRLIFFPEKLPPDFRYDLRAGDQELFLETKDGEKINAIFFRGTNDDVILYLHGNAGSLRSWQYVVEGFLREGYSVLLPDYRSYGKSTGSISESGLYEDAKTAYEYLNKTYRAENILIYGRSIGTGVAVELARTTRVKGLALEAPYTSLSKLASEKLPYFFPGLYIKTRFDNLSKIKQISCPVLFIHGTNDNLIPPEHSEKLFLEASGKKERVLIQGGGHNDLMDFPQYQEMLAKTFGVFFAETTM